MSDSLYDIAKYVQTLIETNQTSLNITDVYYGDQDKIPRVPTACVDTGVKRRQLAGAPRRTQVDVDLYVMVYTAAVASQEVNREQDDLIAENIETLIHQDATMNGLVIDSLVSDVEYGYALRSNSLFRTARLTVTARDLVQLPSSV
jgi:hypothetical protein